MLDDCYHDPSKMYFFTCLGTCTYVKGASYVKRKLKLTKAYKKLQDGWLNNGDKVPPAEFAKIAAEYSECPSGKKGGDLGWFPRGKMAGPFQEVAFNTVVGATSPPFKSTRSQMGFMWNFELVKMASSCISEPQADQLSKSCNCVFLTGYQHAILLVFSCGALTKLNANINIDHKGAYWQLLDKVRASS
ncbi:peptidyl-prolyl cis-trans isomerase NIMA-interacting protein 4 [Tanacetum coccineum]|uniref:Peptidyl-prolyl cis-trans isomerase n=1 Tax=Tanacetum coccineum TaxID=301880 RepID=A0ABQ4WTN7_9ASTR